ncbi:ES1 protein like protein [Chelonia mydas]|uniref:ES1 protein like protein n=1 Tax=Chelonia mydas TaxID=8469 RepID=M7BV58_CHEMY|nr:ES1 protein like protein [Chelonia mydas]
MSKKVAIVLSGCGVYDGSEIHESSAVLVHLSREGAQGEFYAPDVEQMHVVDHVKGQPTQEKRNVLVESARIARGNIKDLATLNVKELDALIIPVLAAKIFPGCELTVGQDKECEKWPYAKTAEAMKELGCKHVNKHVGEIHVDVKNKLVTTSAFMCNAPVHEIYDGIGKMIKEVLKLA